MAENLLVSEDKLVPKSVEEMSMDGDEPSSRYIVNGNTFRSKDSSAQIQIPIIDLSLLSSEGELEKLRSALSSAGFFQAIGHGMSGSFFDKIREVSKQFFELPEEEKQKYGRTVNESDEGYGNDIVVSDKQVLDWSYRLKLRVFPENKRRLSLWPKIPTDFSETLEEFSVKVKSMVEYLLRCTAKSLNLEEGSFVSQFGKQPLMEARFNFYPRCSRPDLVLGAKPHRDASGITVLLQDKEVEGLQIMSNGIFKSIMHRVVTNTERLRISVAMFNKPDPENEIGPVEGLIDESRPRLYINVKNYTDINYRCYQEGKIALETVQITNNSNQK
ncbi:hypothetical protein Fmac_012885 [Flemingia macrophylla]|uniref:Uncharacterized protein n=1 Tax=Flemingia macrophylla TaxID=520843 RepID=A0ABD1MRL4_9FABA